MNRRMTQHDTLSSIVMVLMLCMISWSSLNGAIAQPNTQEKGTPAQQAFWSGEYVKAAQLYSNELAKNTDDPTLWYNLGTVEAYAGRFGYAAHALQMAQLRAPDNPQIRDQLNRVNQASIEDGVRNPGPRRLILPDELSSSGGLISLLSVSLSEGLFWWFFGFLCVSTYGLLQAKRNHKPWVRFRPILGVATLTLSLLSMSFGIIWQLRAVQDSSSRYGIVVEERAPLRRGPALKFDAEVNVAGAVKLELQGSESGWRRVVLSDGREGWIKEDHLKALSL